MLRVCREGLAPSYVGSQSTALLYRLPSHWLTSLRHVTCLPKRDKGSGSALTGSYRSSGRPRAYQLVAPELPSTRQDLNLQKTGSKPGTYAIPSLVVVTVFPVCHRVHALRGITPTVWRLGFFLRPTPTVGYPRVARG